MKFSLPEFKDEYEIVFRNADLIMDIVPDSLSGWMLPRRIWRKDERPIASADSEKIDAFLVFYTRTPFPTGYELFQSTRTPTKRAYIGIREKR